MSFNFSFASFIVGIPTPFPNALPSIQPTVIRGTNGHCLGTFMAVNAFLLLPIKCNVSHYSPNFIPCLLFCFKCSFPEIRPHFQVRHAGRIWEYVWLYNFFLFDEFCFAGLSRVSPEGTGLSGDSRCDWITVEQIECRVPPSHSARIIVNLL
jgi:hypothetical protein